MISTRVRGYRDISATLLARLVSINFPGVKNLLFISLFIRHNKFSYSDFLEHQNRFFGGEKCIIGSTVMVTMST